LLNTKCCTMTKQEDEDLSICIAQKPAMPLYLENELNPLKYGILAEDLEAYKDAISKTIESNIELLKELPPPKNFTLDDLLTHFKKKMKCDLEKDTLFEKSVEVSRYANSMYETMDKYYREIYGLHTSTKKRNSVFLLELSKYFLNSDLDENFLRVFSDSILVSDDYLDLYDSRIKKERQNLVFHKNNISKFERVCTNHNNWVKGFQEKLSLTTRNRVKLLWYVEMNNSNSVEELFKDKFIKTVFLDGSILEGLFEALEKSTTDLEALVTKNASLYSLCSVNVDDSMKTFTSVMDLVDY
jgi:hypothetical protein